MDDTFAAALVIGLGAVAMGCVVMWLAWRRPGVIHRSPVRPRWWRTGDPIDRFRVALVCVAVIVIGIVLLVGALTGQL